MNIVEKFIAAWTRPWAAMLGVKEEGQNASITPAMVFVIVMGVLSGVISAVAGMINPSAAAGAGKGVIWLSALVVPLVSFIGSFIGAFIIWGLVDGFLRGTTSQYKTAYRILAVLAAFSPVSALLTMIPKVGQYLAVAVNIWATIVMIQGIIIVRETPKVRTWVTCGILFAFLFIVGLAARVAAQRQLAGGPDFGAGVGDNYSASDLDKELENLANQAKNDTGAPADTGTTTPKK
jgi:hypothetical protein